MSEYTDSKGLTNYSYYPGGLRKSKTSGGSTTAYYYDGENVIIETVNGNYSARNIWGINPIARQNAQNTTLYYLYNGHADVMAMVDGTGNVINSYDYDIYGSIKESTETGMQNPIKYAGQYYDDESKSYYLRARYYDPELMRFITEDTNKGDVGDPLSLNLYNYCKSNPIMYKDPSGNLPMDEDDLGNGTGGGGLPPVITPGMMDKLIDGVQNIYAKAYDASLKAYIWVESKFNILLKGEVVPQFGRKFDYMFGKATGDQHNVARSKQMLQQLVDIGIEDTPEWRAYVENLFTEAFNDKTNGYIQENGRLAKEFLLTGPNGILKVRAIYESIKLITIEIFGKKGK